MSSQILNDGQYHKEKCVGLEPADKLVMKAEGFTDLFEGEEKRFDLRVHAEWFKDIGNIGTVLVVSVEDSDINDEIIVLFRES